MMKRTKKDASVVHQHGIQTDRGIILSEYFVFNDFVHNTFVQLEEEPGGQVNAYCFKVFWTKFPGMFGPFKVLTFNIHCSNVKIWVETLLPNLELTSQQFCIVTCPVVLKPGWFIVAVQPNDLRPQSSHGPLFLVNTTRNPIAGVKERKYEEE